MPQRNSSRAVERVRDNTSIVLNHELSLSFPLADETTDVTTGKFILSLVFCFDNERFF